MCSGPEEGMRVLSKLAEYSEYLQKTAGITQETHPKIDAQFINNKIRQVANKGRYTLTEIEGYDVRSVVLDDYRSSPLAASALPTTSWCRVGKRLLTSWRSQRRRLEISSLLRLSRLMYPGSACYDA
jgi:hypothetical protein